MIRNIHIIEAENWKADGGACYGVVPKTIWEKFIAADENNLIPLINRLLLVETDKRLILINCGMGAKRDEKFYQYKFVSGQNRMMEQLSQLGFSPLDITDVIFTHLHDDHCGGAVIREEKDNYRMVFPEAIHWCSASQYQNFLKPNPREKGSYFADNIDEIRQCGKLKLIEKEGEFCPGIQLRIFDGHTAGQIIPLIDYKGKTLAYASDFIASASHIPLPYIPAFDVQPLLSMKEKEAFLEEALNKDYVLFFEHDTVNVACTLKKTDKGIRSGKCFVSRGEFFDYL